MNETLPTTSIETPIIAEATVKGRGLWGNAWRRLRKNYAALFSLILLGFIVLLTLLAPYLSPYEYDAVDYDNFSTAPSFENAHYFGTERNGRDLFVRTLYGGRVSLSVGIVATFVSLVIGVLWGAIAGFVGGRVDNIMMRFVDILYAMPFMFFIIMLTVAFGRDILLIYVAIGAITWLDMARIVRGQALSLRRKEFVEAAVAGGVSTFNIIRRHIIPNLLGPVAIYCTLTIPSIILVESFVSFLGLGVQEPETSWGLLISEGVQTMDTAWWSLVFPSVFLAATLFCFNFIGDGLRDALDPKDR